MKTQKSFEFLFISKNVLELVATITELVEVRCGALWVG